MPQEVIHIPMGTTQCPTSTHRKPSHPTHIPFHHLHFLWLTSVQIRTTKIQGSTEVLDPIMPGGEVEAVKDRVEGRDLGHVKGDLGLEIGDPDQGKNSGDAKSYNSFGSHLNFISGHVTGRGAGVAEVARIAIAIEPHRAVELALTVGAQVEVQILLEDGL